LGISFCGENNSNNKLTEDQVKFIKSVYVLRHPQFGARPLAKKYSVDFNTILSIIKGYTWDYLKVTSNVG
jgi:hypothetical protein